MSYWNHLLANFKVKISKTQEDKMNQNNELESYSRIIKRTIIVCFLTKTFFLIMNYAITTSDAHKELTAQLQLCPHVYFTEQLFLSWKFPKPTQEIQTFR